MRSRTSFSVAVIAFVLYLVTLAPAITWANFGTDGGDLITAAVTLGVPHPPGYPLYVTLGHLFAQLPIGTVAFRLNLLSAVCMALAAGLITWSITTPTPTPAEASGVFDPSPVDEVISTEEGGKLPPLSAASRGRRASGAGVGAGVLAGLAFATAPMVWGQATIAEVHALNALFVAMILAVLSPIVFRGEGISSRRLSFAFFLWGLGLTNQLTLLALVPFFFIALRRSLVTAQHPGGTHRFSLITRHSLVFLLALTPYLLILPRAAAQPPINWLGDVTPANFWSLITADLYRGYAFTLPPSEYLTRLTAFAQLLVAQFGWIGFGLIVLGIYRAGRRALAPLISSALYVIFALGYRTDDSQLYLIPIWLFGAYAIAAGVNSLTQYAARITKHARLPHLVRHRRKAAGMASRAVSGPRTTRYIFLITALLVPGFSLITHFAAQDLHADYSAEEFAQRVLTAAPADAIIITHLDAHTFTLWYYRLVENRRSDVTVIDARLAAYPWYDPMLRAQDSTGTLKMIY